MIKIDKYESVIENGEIRFYAIKGKEKFPMPDCYKEMYDSEHLAIESVHRDYPELESTEPDHYIPLRTA